ncbi:hypothetical protein Angca_007678, partial [Angiostrongylus cantonensis]
PNAWRNQRYACNEQHYCVTHHVRTSSKRYHLRPFSSFFSQQTRFSKEFHCIHPNHVQAHRSLTGTQSTVSSLYTSAYFRKPPVEQRFVLLGHMAAWCAENLRNLEGWRSCGLSLSTPSDQCAKLFDGALRQLVSWSDCDALGGLHKTLEDMKVADSKAVLPRAFLLGLESLGTGTCTRVNSVYKAELEQLQADAASYANEREQQHAKAVLLWGEGKMKEATNTWEQILAYYPTDLMAIKFSHDAYFFMGDAKGKRDSIQAVIGKQKSSEPCYSYLHGMLAFGLEECKQYDQAEKEAMKALSLNRFDAWATHARAHVMEMQGRINEGIHFMESTVDYWRPSWLIATHNYWHSALYYVERGDYDVALTIFDNEICERAKKSGSLLDFVDASSILWRLELEGVDVGKRWHDLPCMKTHLDDHVTSFNDTHLDKRGDTAEEMHLHKSLLDFSNNYDVDNAKISREVGIALYEGMILYGRGQYDEAVEKMLPIRHDIYRIGGSNAQRDVFAQTLIHACIMSMNPAHFYQTLTLIDERNALKKDSPISDRLIAKYRKLHPI